MAFSNSAISISNNILTELANDDRILSSAKLWTDPILMQKKYVLKKIGPAIESFETPEMTLKPQRHMKPSCARLVFLALTSSIPFITSSFQNFWVTSWYISGVDCKLMSEYYSFVGRNGFDLWEWSTLWSNDLKIKVLDSQSRYLTLKIAEWQQSRTCLSFFWGRSNDYQELLGTYFVIQNVVQNKKPKNTQKKLRLNFLWK